MAEIRVGIDIGQGEAAALHQYRGSKRNAAVAAEDEWPLAGIDEIPDLSGQRIRRRTRSERTGVAGLKALCEIRAAKSAGEVVGACTRGRCTERRVEEDPGTRHAFSGGLGRFYSTEFG
jgi:hypothetical protein